MKPWEKYQAQGGPWAKYAEKKTVADWSPDAATEGMSFGEQALAGAGKAFVDIWRGVGQFFGANSQEEIDEARRLDAPLMNTGGGIAGNVGANLLTAVVPGANTVKGAALLGAGLAALQPTATGESRLMNTATGGALGAVGAAGGKLIGKGIQAAKGRMVKLADRVSAKAAADAAAETASARSYAGNAAQNAYKQMQVLAAKAEQGALSPDETVVWKSLQDEYLRKAQEKLIPAATAKEISAKAFKEAVDTEAERASALAAQRLSGKEAKNQAMARLKRYGPAAVGGVVGNILFPGMGAVGGAATGLVLRPAIHSIRRLAQNPAVQYQMLRPFASGGGVIGDLAENRLMALLGPSIYAAQE